MIVRNTVSISMRKWGIVTHRLRFALITVWLLLAAAVLIYSQEHGPRYDDIPTVPGTDAQRASDVLKSDFPALAGSMGLIVFHSHIGPLQPDVVVSTLERVSRQPHVVSATNPFEQPGTLSSDSRTGYAIVRYDTQFGLGETEPLERLESSIAPGRSQDLSIEVTGPIVDTAGMSVSRQSEIAGPVLALIVILLAFGSVSTACLPILTAAAGLAVGFGLIGIFSRLLPHMPTQAMQAAAMLGLGTGIDYAMFIVVRVREYRNKGMSPRNALAASMATAGNSVVVAASIVIVAILGLWIVPVPMVNTSGTACAVAVAAMLAATVTFLPALLATFGRKIDRGELPWSGKPSALERWTRWGNHVSKHRWLYVILPTVSLLVMAYPTIHMRLGMADSSAKPNSQSERRAYNQIGEAFSLGVISPLIIVAQMPDRPLDTTELEGLVLVAKSTEGVWGVSQPEVGPNGRVAVISVISSYAPNSTKTERILSDLRKQFDIFKTPGTNVYIGGTTALSVDLGYRIGERLTWLVFFMLSLSTILLMFMFRSIVIPIKAAFLNLLSVGASYGTAVAVFQWGWGIGLLGLGGPTPIYPFVPPIMFATLFSLSMDYEIFLLSRIREAYQNGMDARASVVSGTASTARIIGSAGLIMIAVFSAFILQKDPTVKQFGFLLAIGVALDVTIIRLALVPALLGIFGAHAWWFPSTLGRTSSRSP